MSRHRTGAAGRRRRPLAAMSRGTLHRRSRHFPGKLLCQSFRRLFPGRYPLPRRRNGGLRLCSHVCACLWSWSRPCFELEGVQGRRCTSYNIRHYDHGVHISRLQLDDYACPSREQPSSQGSHECISEVCVSDSLRGHGGQKGRTTHTQHDEFSQASAEQAGPNPRTGEAAGCLRGREGEMAGASGGVGLEG